MGKNEFSPSSKYAQQEIEALRRQRLLRRYLNGEEPFTDTELQLVNQFGGPTAKILAKTALSLRRQNSLRQILNGQTELTDMEKQLASQFTGDNDHLLPKYIIQLHRAGMFRRFLAGTNFDSTLNTILPGKPSKSGNQ